MICFPVSQNPGPKANRANRQKTVGMESTGRIFSENTRILVSAEKCVFSTPRLRWRKINCKELITVNKKLTDTESVDLYKGGN